MDNQKQINIIESISKNKPYEKITTENFLKKNLWLTLFLILLGLVFINLGAYFLFNR